MVLVSLFLTLGSESYCSRVYVCLLSHISPLECLFVLKILSHTQQATKVKEFVGFSLKPLHCENPVLSPLKDSPMERAYVHYLGP